MNERMTAVVGAKISEFRRKMAEVNKIARTTASETVKKIGADASEFHKTMIGVHASLSQLREKTTIKINTEIDDRLADFNEKLDGLADKIRTVGTVAGSVFRGAGFAALPTLSPIIGSTAGAVGGLASSFVAAGGGIGAFALAAIGNIGKLKKSMSEIKSLNEKIATTKDQKKLNELLKQRADIMKGLSEEQKGAMKQVDKFKSGWKDFLKVTEQPVFEVFADGLMVATSLLHEIKPIIDPVSDAISDLLRKFNNFSKTEQFRSFIDFFAKRGSSAIKNWGIIAGNVLNGFMEMMKAFAPLGNDMENGLIGMTKRFADWAAGLKDSEGFKKFVKFVKKNGPKVMDLIGNLTTFLINLGIGMAPLGTKILELVNGFLEWTNSLMKTNPIIGQIIAWITTLGGVLLALAPAFLFVTSMFSGLGTAIKTALGKAFTFIKPLFTDFKATISKLGSKALPMLGRAFAFLTGPIGIIIGILSLLIPVFIRLWKENENFRNGVMTAWEVIKTVFTTVITFISELVKTIIGALVTWWQENQEKFKAIAKMVWDKVYSIVTTVLTTVWDFVKQIVTKIKEFWNEHGEFIMKIAKKAWEFIKTIVIVNLKSAWSMIKGILGIIKGIFQVAWPIISGVVETAWGIIKAVIKTTIDVISGIIDTVMSLIKGDWEGAWDAIKGIAEDIWKNIEGFFADVDLAEIGKDMIEGLMNGIKSMGKALVNSVKGVVDGAIEGAKNLLGIKSPSKVFKQIGIFTGEGMANGMNKMASKVKLAAENMANASVQPMTASFGVSGISGNIRTDQHGAPTSYSSREETHVNMAGVFQGAELTIREDADIDRIAQALGERFKESKRARGIR